MSMPAEHMPTSPNLAALLRGFADAPAIPLKGLASDSRRVASGFLFIACGGARSHGLDFASEAVEAGAVAIAYDASTAEGPPREMGVPVVAVDDLAARLGRIADRFYDEPSARLDVIGVTGTNGKSTVAWLIAECFRSLDRPCRYLGTLNHELTTPPAVELHAKLAEFRDAGAEIAAVEVSSHALSQHRVDGVRFDTALFTNLSRDHLDYHADMREYAEAKARLFLDCRPRHRVISVDSEFGAELARRCGDNLTIVSIKPDHVATAPASVSVRAVESRDGGSTVDVRSSWGDGHFDLSIPGDFNVANAVLVLALLLHKGISMPAACGALTQAEAPPGRMQRVAAPDGSPTVYIDFAHSPEAIEAALRALRRHCRGRLWCVFGCGGNRDSGKRPLMGQAAERFADRVVITNDNPRSEDPDHIHGGIVAGLSAPDAATVIADRAAAIAWTVEHAAPSDVVLIAGKGHEKYQHIGTGRLPFSDYRVASAALEARATEASR